MNEVFEFVGGHDFFGNHVGGDPHVFEPVHWSVEVKVFDVQSHKLCIWGGDGAVEEGFDRCDVGIGCADSARVVNFVAPSCPTNVVGVFFLGSVAGNNA